MSTAHYEIVAIDGGFGEPCRRCVAADSGDNCPDQIGTSTFRCTIISAMFTPTRLFYIFGAALCGSAAGGYVAWAIASRFVRIAELTDRAIVEPHVLIVLCVAGALLAFPLGAAAGLLVVALAIRGVEYLRRLGRGAESDRRSWVTRRSTADDRSGE